MQQKLAQQNMPQVKEQHKVSTSSLPPMPSFDTQGDARRLSSISQPACVQDYVQSGLSQLSEIQSQEQLAYIPTNQVKFIYYVSGFFFIIGA